MDCRICECGARAGVVDSRATGEAWRRRCKCPSCGARWSTIEHRVDGPPMAAFLTMEEEAKSELRNLVTPHIEALAQIFARPVDNANRK